MHACLSQNPQTAMNLGCTAWQLELAHVHTYLCISELEDKGVPVSETAPSWEQSTLTRRTGIENAFDK